LGKIPSIEKLFYNIAEYSDYVPILIFLVLLPKLKGNAGIWLIIAYILFSILSVYIGDLFEGSKEIKHFFISFITLVEYLLFSIFIRLNTYRKRFKFIQGFLSVLFFIFILVYSTTIQFKRIDTLPIGFETILLLSFSFYFFYELMNDPKIVFVYYDYRFWIVLGFVTYLAGSFFIYIFAEQLSKPEFREYYHYVYLFYALKNILFSIGILLAARQPRNKIHHPVPHLDLN
jgi:hypothetical protein